MVPVCLFTCDSCFIYWLRCSQCRLSVCVCPPAVSGHILEVTDPPEGIGCTDSHHLLAQLCRGGGLIQRLSDHQPRLRGAAGDSPGGRLALSYSIFAMLPPRHAAPSATLHHSGPRDALTLQTGGGQGGEPRGSDKAGA